MQFVVFFNNIEKIAMSLLCRERMKLQNKMKLRKSLSRKHAVKNVYYMSCEVQAPEECFCHDLLWTIVYIQLITSFNRYRSGKKFTDSFKN